MKEPLLVKDILYACQGIDSPHTPPPHPRLLPQVKEPLLVKDILYACQGIDGKFTSFQEANSMSMRAMSATTCPDPPCADSGYRVHAQADVAAVKLRLMSRLLELGWMFRCVCVCQGGPWRPLHDMLAFRVDG